MANQRGGNADMGSEAREHELIGSGKGSALLSSAESSYHPLNCLDGGNRRGRRANRSSVIALGQALIRRVQMGDIRLCARRVAISKRLAITVASPRRLSAVTIVRHVGP